MTVRRYWLLTAAYVPVLNERVVLPLGNHQRVLTPFLLAGILAAAMDRQIMEGPAQVRLSRAGRGRRCGDRPWVYALGMWRGGAPRHASPFVVDNLIGQPQCRLPACEPMSRIFVGRLCCAVESLCGVYGLGIS